MSIHHFFSFTFLRSFFCFSISRNFVSNIIKILIKIFFLYIFLNFLKCHKFSKQFLDTFCRIDSNSYFTNPKYCIGNDCKKKLYLYNAGPVEYSVSDGLKAFHLRQSGRDSRILDVDQTKRSDIDPVIFEILQIKRFNILQIERCVKIINPFSFFDRNFQQV